MRTALALQTATFARSLTARLGTVLLVLLPPLFSVGLVALARSPQATGPSAAKLAPYAEGTFAEGVASLAGQVIPVTMLIVVGFAVSWLVGREWADGTYGSLFSLPTSRAALATSKLTVVFVWSAAALSLAMALIAGAVAVLGERSLTGADTSSLVKVWFAGLIMCALALPFGWVAVRFRGFLGAVGAIIAVTAASQILASLGAATWVPYVAPAMWAGAGGSDAAAAVAPAALALAVAFAAAGAWAAVRAFASARLD